MIKLLIETPEGKTEHVLDKAVILGREESCDIQILDPLSSRKHCRIYQEGEEIYVEDLKSSNGTRVNQQVIQKKKLSEEDTVQIGEVKIKVLRETKEKVSAAKAPKVEKVDFFIKLTSNGKVKEIPLDRSTISFGREDTNDIVLNEKLSSRRHCKVHVEGAQIYMEDLGSSNGTKINGEKLTGKKLVKPGDVILIGSTKIEFVGNGEPDSSSEETFCYYSRKGEQKEILLSSKKIIFGRDESCDFVLNEQNASRKHFQLYLENGKIYFEDLGSSNGTKVNGVKVQKAQVKNSDVIEVGDSKFSFEKAKQEVLKVVVTKDISVREFPFKDGMTLGRGDENDIVVYDEKASRKHASLMVEEDKFYIEDFNSSNGTKVDGVKITKKEITTSSTIEIGKTKIQIIKGSLDSILGKTLKGYEVLRCLSVDDNGSSYMARQKSMKRTVSLKVIAKKFLETEEKKQKFLNDTKKIAPILHGHLQAVIESFVEVIDGESKHILVTEYVEGLPLSKRLEKNGVIKTNNAIHFAEQACQALSVLHEKGVFHQNIRPSVFLITKDGKVKLSDIGFSKPGKQSESELSSEAIWYEAPERTKGGEPSVASDIYEMGATLYHAVTGVVPFDGKTALAVNTKKMNRLPEEPKTINSSISDVLNRVIMKCMQIEPSVRYASALALCEELQSMKAAPVEWELENDYEQIERIRKQDLASTLWVFTGVLCILFVVVNLLMIQAKDKNTSEENDFLKMEKIVSDGTLSLKDKVAQLETVSQESTSDKIKLYAKDIAAVLKGRRMEETHQHQVDLYKNALDDLVQGNLANGMQKLENLLRDVDIETPFGQKVKSKLDGLKAGSK